MTLARAGRQRQVAHGKRVARAQAEAGCEDVHPRARTVAPKLPELARRGIGTPLAFRVRQSGKAGLTAKGGNWQARRVDTERSREKHETGYAGGRNLVTSSTSGLVELRCHGEDRWPLVVKHRELPHGAVASRGGYGVAAGRGVVLGIQHWTWADPHLTFVERWGRKSWKVRYLGPYDNTRIPHVEVRRASAPLEQIDLRNATFRLANLRRRRDREGCMTEAVVWDVVGLWVAGAGDTLAHFTVHYGWRPVSCFSWA